LANFYEAKGISKTTAMEVAQQLTKRDALAAHLAAEFNIDQTDIASPWHAALASAVAFTIGGILPLASMLLVPSAARVPVTFVAVLIALAITGSVAAHIGGSPKLRATVRVTIGGALALAATFGIGPLLGSHGIG
jgi:VIT1/CCC1 family predicted Fe2+/Mn2+ transporter